MATNLKQATVSDIHVVVGVPTFKRPLGLTKLLSSLAVQKVDFAVTVLVADNDGDLQEGCAVVNSVAKNYPFPLHLTVVSEQGISNVRNALLEGAFLDLKADMLAMVDDDEWVDPLWLSSLVDMQGKESVDIVSGAVLPEFEYDPPKWVNGLSLYWRRIHKDGRIDLVQGTTSVLLNRSVWERFSGERFDVDFGLTGGGDKEFFTRIKSKGATFAFASKSVSYEYFGHTRLTQEWALSRMYRIGSGDMRIVCKHNLGVCLELLKTVVGLVWYSFSCVLCFFNQNKRFHSKLKIYRQLGKLNGFFGKPLIETYREIHGK